MRLKTIFFILFVVMDCSYAALPARFFIFGDSLTDSGYQNNNPQVQQLGKSPEWTSPGGHTWVYYFLKNYKQAFPNADTRLLPNNLDAATFFNPVPTNIHPILDGNNFAAGGSTTGGRGILNTKAYKAPSLLNQVDYFVENYVSNHDLLVSKQAYLIWSGGNDLIKKLMSELWMASWLKKLHLMGLATTLHFINLKDLSQDFVKTEANIAANLRTAVKTLEDAGAEKIIVILLPDMGSTPFIRNLAVSIADENANKAITAQQFLKEMDVITRATNQMIQIQLAGTKATVIDINTVLRPLATMPTPGYFQETKALFGKEKKFFIVNNTGSACLPNEKALTCIPHVKDAVHYVFEDLLHPTDQTHQILGDYLYYVIANRL